MKKCTKCGEAKPREDFHRNASMSDGRNSWCKKCLLAKQEANRRAAGVKPLLRVSQVKKVKEPIVCARCKNKRSEGWRVGRSNYCNKCHLEIEHRNALILGLLSMHTQEELRAQLLKSML